MTKRFSRLLSLDLFAFTVALTCIAALLLTPAMALAAAATSGTVATTVDITNVLNLVIGLLFVAIGAVLIWALKRYASKLGLDINESQRALLNETIGNALKWAEKEVADIVDSKAGKIDVKNEMVAQAANYVVQHASDAVKHLGVTDAQLERKILAALPK